MALRIFYYLVLLASFVSVSLYVSMDFCKFLQAWFMQQSLHMYDDISDTPMKVGSAFLCDELGRISHIFSDKTGTLTQNVMQFRKCSVNGITYGQGTTEIGLARMRRLGITPPEQTQVQSTAPAARTPGQELINFEGDEILYSLLAGTGDNKQQAP